MKKKNKGFTLIELLAVIIILGILMLIAVPSVTTYVNSSRKNAYIASAKKIVEGVSMLIASKQVVLNEDDTTYYIPGACIATESGDAVSPYADWKDRYIVVTYDSEKQAHDYYWASTDEVEMGVYLTYRDKLDVDDVKTGVKEITTDVGIGEREKIVVFEEPCDFNPPAKPALEHIPEKGKYVPPVKPEPTEPTTPTVVNDTHSTDGLTWVKEPFQIKFDKVTSTSCSDQGRNMICYNAQFIVTNTSSTETIKWYYAEFDVPQGTQMVSASYTPDQATVEIDGTKLKIHGINTQTEWNFLRPGKSFKVGFQLQYPKGTDFKLRNGYIEFKYLSADVQTGDSGMTGSPDDMFMQLAKLKIELVRKHYWNVGGPGSNIAAQYDVIVYNTTNKDMTDWQFILELPESYVRLDLYQFDKIQNGREYTIRPRNKNQKSIPAGGKVKISDAFQMEMKDPNILPIIK